MQHVSHCILMHQKKAHCCCNSRAVSTLGCKSRGNGLKIHARSEFTLAAPLSQLIHNVYMYYELSSMGICEGKGDDWHPTLLHSGQANEVVDTSHRWLLQVQIKQLIFIIFALPSHILYNMRHDRIHLSFKIVTVATFSPA